MENYIGKICPFCKTEITDADTVKVCTACGIPHHEGCWEENHGCTTFGCSEQLYEAQHTNPTDVCANCGAPLGDGQAFCPRCGTPKAAIPQKNVCGKCGNELQDGQEFCPRCGQKAGLAMDAGVSLAIERFNSNLTQTKKKKRLLPIAIVAGIVAILAIVLAAFFLRQPKVEKIELSKSNLDMYVGDSATLTYELTYAVEPEDGDDVEVSWKSTNTDVAKVSSSGDVTAVGAGTCTITVTAGGKKDKVTVTVRALKSQESAILGRWDFTGGLDEDGDWMSSYYVDCEIELYEDKTGYFYIGSDKNLFTWSYSHTSESDYIYNVSFDGGMLYDVGEKTLYVSLGDYFLGFER